jgi:hypothetical protein
MHGSGKRQRLLYRINHQLGTQQVMERCLEVGTRSDAHQQKERLSLSRESTANTIGGLKGVWRQGLGRDAVQLKRQTLRKSSVRNTSGGLLCSNLLEQS